MVSSFLAFDYYVINIGELIFAICSRSTVEVILTNVVLALWSPFAILTKQYVSNGVIKLVNSSSSFLIQI